MPVLTAEIAKEDYLSIKGTEHDAALARRIAHIEERVARWLGFARFSGASKPQLDAADYTLFTHARVDQQDRGPWGQGIQRLDWSPSFGLVRPARARGVRRLLLPIWPVSSIASVHQDEQWVFGASSLVDPDDYSLFADTWALVKAPGKASWSAVDRAIKITLSAGYTAENTPGVLIDAVGKQLAHEWNNRQRIGHTSVAADGATTAVRSFKLLPSVTEQLADLRLPEAGP